MRSVYPAKTSPQPLYITINNLKIINLIRYNKSIKEIAIELDISTSTVHDQLNSIYKKLAVSSKEDLKTKIDSLNLKHDQDVGVLLHTSGHYELKEIPKFYG